LRITHTPAPYTSAVSKKVMPPSILASKAVLAALSFLSVSCIEKIEGVKQILWNYDKLHTNNRIIMIR